MQWFILKKYRLRVWASVGAVLLITYSFIFAPPSSFPTDTTFVVKRGEAATHIAERMAKAHLVAHAWVLTGTLRLMGASNRVQAGPYRFPTREGALSIAFRLFMGDYGISPARITFLEGTTLREIAPQIAAALPEITVEEVIDAAKGQEGYLFPDTYLFSPGADAEDVVATMRENFRAKTSPYLRDILGSGHSLSEIVTMASLIEREARTLESKKMVSGILWHRMKLGMPLQVDAVFGYIFNRSTYSPSYADLKVDSPYNTYTHTGLPPGPISNPGLESIDAALHPTESPYLFYLTGRDGKMYYATTYATHQANQRRALP